LPFAIYIAFLVLESLLGRITGENMGAASDTRWLYAVKIGCVALALVLLWARYGELTLRNWPNAKWIFTAIGAGLLVLVLWVNLTMPWAVIGASDGFDPRDAAGTLNWPLVVVRTLGAALVVPVMEELFWRSFVMRWIQQPQFLALVPQRVGIKALLVSAVVFGFEHSLWFAGIVAGLAYGWLYVRSGNLWVPVIAHAVTNGGLAAWVVMTQQWQFW
jgi:hypothetical protein